MSDLPTGNKKLLTNLLVKIAELPSPEQDDGWDLQLAKRGNLHTVYMVGHAAGIMAACEYVKSVLKRIA